MQPEIIIINRPAIDSTTFLGVAMKVLGHSLSISADASAIEMGDSHRFLSCLASMCGTEESNLKLLPHISVGILIVADEPDLLDILECAAGMPFIKAETVARNVFMAVVTGTLAQWKVAVIAGSSSECETTVRAAYNKLHGLLRTEFLNMWTDFQRRTAPDRITFLLEDKR